MNILNQTTIAEDRKPISDHEHWRIHQIALRTSFGYNYVYRVLVVGDRYSELIWLEYARTVKEDMERTEEIAAEKESMKLKTA